MQSIKKIAVIGATGRLGAPVATELAKSFSLRALVRSPDKAKDMLPSNVEIVKADLKDVSSLKEGLKDMDAIYISLATETTDLNLPFYEEREGVQNIINACKGLDIRYIVKIGALGAYPPALERVKFNAVPNIIRLQGHKIIAESGIRHTFFEPTHFMELLPMLIENKNLQWIGRTDLEMYWISVVDYARMVVKAFHNYETMSTEYSVQGPEQISVKDAMDCFIKNYDPTLSPRVGPLWMMKLIGIFSPKMKFLAHLFEYFGNNEEVFYSEETWEVFGKPSVTLEEFCKTLREKEAEKEVSL
ncbi:hypothetical protein DASB73_015790 [Starmerella bacillaris]|uniref:NAD(P)-binding domain-containing protein n=1 Tax=Starmerella bacillaris TaxID=1247836 RepID=A0AAV5RJ26_STABA|nr:hypothetical protein DASB73_015790 [Starmerella bacillaris]